MRIRPLPCGSKYKLAKAAEARSQEVDRNLMNSRWEEKLNRRILVLGPPGSGKSTILNSLKLSATELSSEDREAYKLLILDHIVLSTQNIAKQLFEHDIQPPEQIKDILKRPLRQQSQEVSLKSAQVLRMIWDNDEFRTSFTTLQEKQIEIPVPNLKYLLDNYQRVLSDGYIPTAEDIIQLSIPSCQNYEVRAKVTSGLDQTWVAIEPGQYATTQPKWWTYFKGVDAMFFVISLSEYDAESAFKEPMNQLRAVCHAPCFSTTVIILMLNKIDLLEEKLAIDPLENYFPEYTGGNEFSVAVRFLIDLFVHEIPCEKVVYIHTTRALDYHQHMRLIFNAVYETLNRQICYFGAV